MARQETAKKEARLTTKPCGELGIWIYVDGELMDLIHYSDLRYALTLTGSPVLTQNTIDAIDGIYADLIKQRSEEE